MLTLQTRKLLTLGARLTAVYCVDSRMKAWTILRPLIGQIREDLSLLAEPFCPSWTQAVFKTRHLSSFAGACPHNLRSDLHRCPHEPRHRGESCPICLCPARISTGFRASSTGGARTRTCSSIARSSWSGLPLWRMPGSLTCLDRPGGFGVLQAGCLQRPGGCFGFKDAGLSSQARPFDKDRSDRFGS